MKKRKKQVKHEQRLCGNCARGIDEELMAECIRESKPYYCWNCKKVRFGRNFLPPDEGDV